MQVTTRRREYREGAVGRRRTYRCRKRDNKYQIESLGSLPIGDRVCPECRKVAEAKCQHHWLIEEPLGATSEGVCRLCGGKRSFLNYWPEPGSRLDVKISAPGFLATNGLITKPRKVAAL